MAKRNVQQIIYLRDDGVAEVQLTQGKTALIDEADIELVKKRIWYAHHQAGGHWYAASSDRDLGQTTMHRYLMGEPDSIVDHVSGNGLDNRRCNLRLATHGQNIANSRRRKRKSVSGFRGVYLLSNGKWQAAISDGPGTTKTLGSYTSRIKAASVYNEAAKERYGEFATLNHIPVYPEKGESIPDRLLNQITVGDAKRLSEQIPLESIDLVFADPIYDRFEDYAWLAETASLLLRPDRSLLAWTSQPKEAKCRKLMQTAMNYVYTLSYVVPAKTYRLNNYHIFCWTTPCLWMRKGKGLPNKWLPDTFIDHSSPATDFKWNKNPAVVRAWLEAFCPPSGTVFDPFAGTGVVPAMCDALGLNYIAFEQDAERAALAKERVGLPMFKMDPEPVQLAMGLTQ